MLQITIWGVGEINGSTEAAAVFHGAGVAARSAQKGEMTETYTRSMCGQPFTDY